MAGGWRWLLIFKRLGWLMGMVITYLQEVGQVHAHVLGNMHMVYACGSLLAAGTSRAPYTLLVVLTHITVGEVVSVSQKLLPTKMPICCPSFTYLTGACLWRAAAPLLLPGTSAAQDALHALARTDGAGE